MVVGNLKGTVVWGNFKGIVASGVVHSPDNLGTSMRTTAIEREVIGAEVWIAVEGLRDRLE